MPLNSKHNQYLYVRLIDELDNESDRPIVDEFRLKQELMSLKDDYDRLYDEYLYTHKRMQYAFRELHKFKRSAWKYKKIVLSNQALINNLEKVDYYKRRINKGNIRKFIKLVLKKVKSL